MATQANSSSSIPAITTNQPESFQSDLHCEELLKNLQDRQDLCDVVLKTGDDSKCIRAHRLILIGSSEYFSSLLSAESQEREVTINDVDGDALEKLVNYCYTGKLEFEANTIQGLFKTAKHLHLQKVVDGCCDFIQRHLNTSNCLSAAFFAEQQNIKPLFDSIKKFIEDNFTEVSNSPDFLLLNVELLKEFITSDKLNVPSEEFLFEVIMKWIDYEPENRRKHFGELLTLLRLNLMSHTFLCEKVEPLCKTMETYKLVFNALKSHVPVGIYSPYLENDQSKHLVTATKKHENEFVELMPWNDDDMKRRCDYDDDDELYSIELFAYPELHISEQHLLAISKRSVDGEYYLKIDGYNFLTCKWTSYDTKIRYRPHCAVSLIDDNLIVVGGRYSAEITSINLRTMDSKEMTPLLTTRYYHEVAVLNGSIYAIGGSGGNCSLNSVEKWDLATRQWNFVAPMKNARRSFGVAVLNGYLYVSGGWNNCMLASVECYDPVANTWTERSPMKAPRFRHCLASYNGYLYAFGGVGNTSAERYDPKTNTWSLISCSPPIEDYILCASLEKDVFIWNNKKVYQITNESSENLNMKKLCDKYFEYPASLLCYVGELGKDYNRKL